MEENVEGSKASGYRDGKLVDLPGVHFHSRILESLTIVIQLREEVT